MATITQVAPSYDEHVTVVALSAADAAASEWVAQMVPPPARLLRACEFVLRLTSRDRS